MSLEPASASPWRTVSSRVVYTNPWTTLIEDRLEGPDGRSGMYGYFQARDAVLVLPLHADGSTVLVRQWRHAYECSSWEAVCGAVEDGESIATAAARELAEEAGLEARRWSDVGVVHPSDSRVGGRTFCFIAEDLVPTAGVPDPSECDLVRERLPLADAVAAVMAGRITHVASAFLVLRAWHERLTTVGVPAHVG